MATLRFCTGTPRTLLPRKKSSPEVGSIESGHDLHQRRLAGERRAEEDVERAVLEHEVGVADMDIGADAIGHVPEFEGHARPRSFPGFRFFLV